MKMSEWHNTKDELPPQGKVVIVESKLGHRTTCWITSEGTWAGNLEPIKWKYDKEEKK